MSNGEYSGISTYLSSKLESRSEYGQFFTPFSIVNLCIQKCIELSGNYFQTILEPSCGPLQFVLKINEQIKFRNIVAYELDKTIYDDIVNNSIENFSVYNRDFLLDDSEAMYDLIIGNPPYVELSDYPQKYTKTPCCTGRYNIYGMFIEKCIQMLNDNGLLCFVLPLSLMSAPSFCKLREYIISTCNIEWIVNLNNFSNEVSQDVGIFIFRRVKPQYKHMNYVGDNNCFSYQQINRSIKRLKIKDIAKVATGTIVWNQNRSFLNENQGLRLIYSHDIGNIKKGIIKITNDEKLPYVKTTKEGINLPAIFVNRGKVLKYELVEESKIPLIAENHVNVITSTLENLQKIVGTFETDEFKNYVASMATTLNFSKTQLENVPLF